MEIFLYSIITEEETKINYPNKDIKEPVKGLDPTLKIYIAVDDDKPVYDDASEQLVYSTELTDESHPDYPHLLLKRGHWTIIPRVFPTIEESKAKHYQDLKDVTQEISSIVSSVKNIYDPLRKNLDNFPIEFENLVNMILPLRQQAISEIEALITEQEAYEYAIRGQQVEGFIEQLKSFL